MTHVVMTGMVGTSHDSATLTCQDSRLRRMRTSSAGARAYLTLCTAILSQNSRRAAALRTQDGDWHVHILMSSAALQV